MKYWPLLIIGLAAVSAYRPLLIHWLATWRTPDVDLGDYPRERCSAQCAECSRYARAYRQIDEDWI